MPTLEEKPQITESDVKRRIAPKFRKTKDTVKYTLLSVAKAKAADGKIYARVQVKGTKEVFSLSIRELYTKEWLPHFSAKDAAQIGFIASSEVDKNYETIKAFPQKKSVITPSVVVLAMLFVSCLITSNILVAKIAFFEFSAIPFLSNFKFLNVHSDAGILIFPFTFFFCDVLTEVYGFRTSRIVIWGGLFCVFLTSLGLTASISLPPSSYWEHQGAYSTVLGASFTVFGASFVAYFFGEFTNSFILSRLKVITRGRFLFFRAATSTLFGNIIDTLIFFFIAIYGRMPTEEMWHTMVVSIILRMAVEVMLLPGTYALSNYLKKKDNTDVYDYSCSLNPFSIGDEKGYPKSIIN